MDKNNWSSVGGTSMGVTLEGLLRERPSNMARLFDSCGYDKSPVPEGDFNFIKEQNVMYPWDNTGRFMVKAPHSEIEDSEDVSSFKKLYNGNNGTEERKTLTKIFK